MTGLNIHSVTTWWRLSVRFQQGAEQAKVEFTPVGGIGGVLKCDSAIHVV